MRSCVRLYTLKTDPSPIGGYPGIRVAFGAMCFSHMHLPTFAHTVSLIVRIRSRKQVIRPKAGRVVTLMTNAKIISKRAIGKHIRNSMCVKTFSFY